MKKRGMPYKDYIKMMTPERKKEIWEITKSIFRIEDPNMSEEEMRKRLKQQSNTTHVSFIKRVQ